MVRRAHHERLNLIAVKLRHAQHEGNSFILRNSFGLSLSKCGDFRDVQIGALVYGQGNRMKAG